MSPTPTPEQEGMQDPRAVKLAAYIRGHFGSTNEAEEYAAANIRTSESSGLLVLDPDDDDLRELMAEALRDGQPYGTQPFDDDPAPDPFETMVEVLVTAIRGSKGLYRARKPSESETMHDLDDVQAALPGTVIKDNRGRVFQRYEDNNPPLLPWGRIGYETSNQHTEIALPARVLS